MESANHAPPPATADAHPAELNASADEVADDGAADEFAHSDDQDFDDQQPQPAHASSDDDDDAGSAELADGDPAADDTDTPPAAELDAGADEVGESEADSADAPEAAVAEELPEGIPEDEELSEITSDLDDVEKVLAQLDKENPELDELCAAAEADGTLADRPALDAFWKVKSRRDA